MKKIALSRIIKIGAYRSQFNKIEIRPMPSKRTDAHIERLKKVGKVPPINPDFFYRIQLLPQFIGLERSQINEAIRDGELPQPVRPTNTARTRGYYVRSSPYRGYFRTF